MTRRYAISALVVLALVAILAVPALAGVGQGNGKGQAKEKVPSAPISITGTIAQSTDADGDDVYTMASGGKTYTLHAGPKWFYDEYPLESYVGQSVTVVGEIAEGSNDVDVFSIDGKTIRAAGKPPWAGGWKVVGERHPGWSQEKADRFKAKFGDCFPPGQCKTKPGASGDPAD